MSAVVTDYRSFLARKTQYGKESGFAPLWMPEFLFDFQRSVVEWNLRKGRSATFADCGLGKTPMALVWAENVIRKTNGRVLNLAPLAVGPQTIREAEKFGIGASLNRDGKRKPERIEVTNYERLHYFDPADFTGVVCDESSILKSFDGQTKARVTEFMRQIPYRLLCTATAAPNDYIELGTSSEALGEMGHIDMLNRFFKNDQNTSDTRLMKRQPINQGGPKSAGWRFKGHAEQPYWRFITSWARAGRRPSDFGPFDDSLFDLPELIETEHVVETRTLAPGMLFPLAATNMREEREERKRTIQERCEMAAELVSHDDSAVIWCHRNAEGDLLDDLIPDGAQIAGATPDDRKEELYEAFANGQLRVLIIKPKIGAWGLNWQHCAHVVTFASHSYEQYYQAVRRCWRFGQLRKVRVDLVVTEGERGAADNLKRKSRNADRMFTNLVAHMHEAAKVASDAYEQRVEVPTWV